MVVPEKCSSLRVPFVLGKKFCSGVGSSLGDFPNCSGLFTNGPALQANGMPFTSGIFLVLLASIVDCGSIAEVGAVSYWNRIAVVVVRNWGLWIGLQAGGSK